jgi:hypothetical protein
MLVPTHAPGKPDAAIAPDSVNAHRIACELVQFPGPHVSFPNRPFPRPSRRPCPAKPLLDFAKMMEMFDKRQISFVSVTQQFTNPFR